MLESVTAASGNASVLVADGVTSAALSPAGDHVAYIRNGKVEVLALTPPATVEIVPTSAPVIAGWTKDGKSVAVSLDFQGNVTAQ